MSFSQILTCIKYIFYIYIIVLVVYNHVSSDGECMSYNCHMFERVNIKTICRLNTLWKFSVVNFLYDYGELNHSSS